MGIKILVEDDNDAGRSQIDAHAAYAHIVYQARIDTRIHGNY